MVVFVLDGAGEQAAAGELDGLALVVDSPDFGQGGTFDFAVDFREAQAAFGSGDGFASGLDGGVDENQGHDGGDVGLFAVQLEGGRPVSDAAEVQDCQLQSQADLLGGQADALVGVHGFEHGGGERLDVRA